MEVVRYMRNYDGPAAHHLCRIAVSMKAKNGKRRRENDYHGLANRPTVQMHACWLLEVICEAQTSNQPTVLNFLLADSPPDPVPESCKAASRSATEVL